MTRARKPELTRTAPIRLTSGFWRAPESDKTRENDVDRERPTAPGRVPTATSDYLAQGVKVGYDVLESYLRRGQEVARDARKLTRGDDPKDPADVLDRSVRVVRQYAILMMELSETLMKAPDLWRSFRRMLDNDKGGERGNGGTGGGAPVHSEDIARLMSFLSPLLGLLGKGEVLTEFDPGELRDKLQPVAARTEAAERQRAWLQTGCMGREKSAIIRVARTDFEAHHDLCVSTLINIRDDGQTGYKLEGLFIQSDSATNNWILFLDRSVSSIDRLACGVYHGFVVTKLDRRPVGQVEVTVIERSSGRARDAADMTHDE